jgi:hypothetical protein
MNISIVAGLDEEKSSIAVSGKEMHVITEEEKATFGLNDHALKEAVKKYFGKAPNDVFIRSPTPWNDLYKTYGWKQVTTKLRPVSGHILEVTSEPTVVKTAKFENNSSQDASFNVSISESVTDTSTSTWSTGGSLSFSQKIEYGVKFLGVGGKGETAMSFTGSWGTGGSHSKSITVGSTSGVDVTLKPGKGVESVLSATRGVMKVEVKYNASLSGSVAVNYNPTYKGHHFYGLPVSAVMDAGGIPTFITSTETIEIGYFSDSKLKIQDLNE